MPSGDCEENLEVSKETIRSGGIVGDSLVDVFTGQPIDAFTSLALGSGLCCVYTTLRILAKPCVTISGLRRKCRRFANGKDIGVV
jgi:hypothetical protein